MTDPRYPIGRYEPQAYSEELKKEWLNNIRRLPAQLESAIQNLDAEHLNSPYREGGWTIQQLVHHIADSHMNAYIRFKLAITEENLTVKSYDEKLWAELVRRFPKLAAHRANVRLSRNWEYADAQTQFLDTDEVALIPPVSGG